MSKAAQKGGEAFASRAVLRTERAIWRRTLTASTADLIDAKVEG